MNDEQSNSEPSEAVLEIGRRFYPRRRRRYPDLRDYQAACDWARSLDWRNNPYERFLLRRELLHYIDTATHLPSMQQALRLAAAGEVVAVVDHLLDTLTPTEQRIGVFASVLLRLPWELASRHGRIRYSHLTKALHAANASPK